jgi:hypothetical protein
MPAPAPPRIALLPAMPASPSSKALPIMFSQPRTTSIPAPAGSWARVMPRSTVTPAAAPA